MDGADRIPGNRRGKDEAAMKDLVIRAQQLTKVYRLYKGPTDRLRDALGLLRDKARYAEHTALDGVDLSIRRGEKVGIIGRNGAGKSTLLKLITQTIEPTTGTLEIKGATQALLQIGTGFHPEFTGRDNVTSYLAQLGIAGDKASRLTREVIDFAEVEEYIDQPVKTYSTGMSARLMFAASTVIEPDILVIDEVLGVGDAYFARKSYERIKALCKEHDSTLLLVSHDIYSAAQVCDRMVWIDRGCVKFDGPSKEAINLYEASIKEQEEQRLRRKAALAPGLSLDDEHARHVMVEIKAPNGKPMPGLLFFYEQMLADNTVALARVSPTSGTSDRDTAMATGNALELVYEGSNWLTTEEASRSDGIILANYGQPYHKGSLRARFRLDIASPKLQLVVESAGDQSVQAVVYDRHQVAYDGGTIALKSGNRTEWEVPLDTEMLTRLSELVEAGSEVRHGSGAVRITGVDALDGEGKSSRRIRTGEPASLRLSLHVLDGARAGDVEVMIAVFKDGVVDAMRVFKSGLDLSEAGRRGRLDIKLASLPLGPGKYVASLLIAKSGYYAKNDGRPFSVHPDVYDALSRSLEFEVLATCPSQVGTMTMADAHWNLTIAPDEARMIARIDGAA